MESRRVLSLVLALAVLAFSGCGGFRSLPNPEPASLSQARADLASPIEHVVVVIQENRSFNDFFATFPGADGTTTGKVAVEKLCGIKKAGTIPLKEADLEVHTDPGHRYSTYVTSRDGGKMDGFDRALIVGLKGIECTLPYQYTKPSQIKPYWDLAEQYVLAEHMFQTQGSDSFTAHQDLIAGGTQVKPNKALVDIPTCGDEKCTWGCDAPPGTRTSLISSDDVYRQGRGPFPCLDYATLRDLLDAKGISWKYYVPPMSVGMGRLMSAFDAIRAVRYGPQWHRNISTPQTSIFNDIKKDRLPAVSWLVPDADDSDHPGVGSTDTGPSWVAAVVNAIGKSPEWNSTAIVILWDDWGGFYDNVNPPQYGYGSLGFRVPAIIVSPYAKHGYIAKTQYEFGSILKYIENNWHLGRLGTSDERATSIIDCFDYSQKPRKFIPIAVKYPESYFLTRPPSYRPVDTDM
jgi:phospholipase C